MTGVQTFALPISPPKLFDLTSLQREANRIYGYTAKQTLDLAQTLYEKKLHDLELTRMVSIQMAPQIRLVQNNDTLMSEKIQNRSFQRYSPLRGCSKGL